MKVATDAQLSGRLLDEVDRSAVALDGEPCALFAMPALDFCDAVVDGVREVRGGDAGHAAGKRAVFENNHLFALLQKLVRGG